MTEVVYVGPRWQVTCADAVAYLRSFQSGSFDCVITDPPYESLEKHRAVGTTTRLKHSKASSNDWFTIFPNSRFEELFSEVYRVLAKNAHFYLFVDLDTMFVAKPIAEAAGFKFWNAIVWDKVEMGMGYHYRKRKEFVLFFEKGKRRLNSLGVPDILDVDVGVDVDVDVDVDVPRPRSEPLGESQEAEADSLVMNDEQGTGNREWKREERGVDTIVAPRIHSGYPTEKPVAVSEILIQQSTNPGESVCDPFVGSGSTGVAAIKHGRWFFGCDVAQGAVDVAQKRLTEWSR